MERTTLTREVAGSSPAAVVQPRGVTVAHNTLTVTDAVRIRTGLAYGHSSVGRVPV